MTVLQLWRILKTLTLQTPLLCIVSHMIYIYIFFSLFLLPPLKLYGQFEAIKKKKVIQEELIF